MKYERFLVRTIGYVENEFSVPAAPQLVRAAQSRIILDPDLAGGVLGLEAGSQILVVFCTSRSSGNNSIQDPRGDRRLPSRGAFALRSLNRSNPIGVSIVELLAVEGNVLLVQGLDATAGTPVLDIKPALSSVIQAAELLVRTQARVASRLKSAKKEG